MASNKRKINWEQVKESIEKTGIRQHLKVFRCFFNKLKLNEDSIKILVPPLLSRERRIKTEQKQTNKQIKNMGVSLVNMVIIAAYNFNIIILKGH